MKDNLNRRGFLGLLTGIAALLGFSKKNAAEAPFVPPPPPEAQSDRWYDKVAEQWERSKAIAAANEQQKTRHRPKDEYMPTKEQVEVSLKNSKFLICPQCGSDMQWARCECGFTWTNRVDEIAGGHLDGPVIYPWYKNPQPEGPEFGRQGNPPDSLTLVKPTTQDSLTQEENGRNGWENRGKA